VRLVRARRAWLADWASGTEFESGFDFEFGLDSDRGRLEGFARGASGRSSGRGSRRRGERLPSSLEL
jgi:hypothetical protein